MWLPLSALAAPVPIVGGTSVQEGDWPDVAAVSVDGYVQCTGTLIAPDLVLTAGHCIEDGAVADSVRLDTNRWNAGGEVIAVVDQIEYPDSWHHYDIAVLELAQPSTVTPRVIAQGDLLQYLVDGAPVQIVGYGAIDAAGGTYVDRMQEAEVVIIDANCDNGDGCNVAVSPDGELRAGLDGVDTCYGDSGGPLYLWTPDGPFLAGVTSRGAWSASYCGHPSGGIYPRPDAVIDWIEEQTGRTLPRPGPNETVPDPVVEPVRIEVAPGETAYATVDPRDPDPDDTHTYSTRLGPEHGVVVFEEDGVLAYHANNGYKGGDGFFVVATDSAGQAGEVYVDVDIHTKHGERGGCGCTASPGPWWAIALVLPLIRRGSSSRRSTSSCATRGRR